MKPHLVIIDPAVKKPELDCLNHIVQASPLPVTYHLPAIAGMESLEKETDGLAGIIVLGSMSSVHDRLPWQGALENWLLPQMENKIPTLGICYGHQMIAHMYGGKVDYHSGDKRKRVGFETTHLHANPLWENKPLSGKVYVSHCEAVTAAPKEMAITASREGVPVDGLVHKQLPIWTFQTHPEATNAFLTEEGITRKADPKLFEFGHSIIQYFLNFVGGKR
jgi:GMP synthase (glutamine-hydrolysing)